MKFVHPTLVSFSPRSLPIDGRDTNNTPKIDAAATDWIVQQYMALDQSKAPGDSQLGLRVPPQSGLWSSRISGSCKKPVGFPKISHGLRGIFSYGFGGRRVVSVPVPWNAPSERRALLDRPRFSLSV